MQLQNGEVNLRRIYPQSVWEKTQEMLFEYVALDDKGQPVVSDVKEAAKNNVKIERYKILQMVESITIDGKPLVIDDEIFSKLSRPDYLKILKEIDKIAGIGEEELPL